MKLSILIFGVFMLAVPAMADDTVPAQKLAARKTCAEIKTEIENLSAIVNPNDEVVAQLNAVIAWRNPQGVAR